MAGSGQVVVAIIIDTNSLQNSRGGLKNSPWLGGFMGEVVVSLQVAASKSKIRKKET